ncbi:MAG: hypothetical protein IJD60_01485 [Clostridia bacterium]|nr:hypothetical protein [Clostridia bacterium]
MSNAISLTNKTAISLRKNAVRMKTLHFIYAAVLSVVMAAAAVGAGILWLPAAPIILALMILLDVLIVFKGRSVYLSMIGQAICTEAAAREIRAGSSEMMRREQAMNDLMQIRADVSAKQKQQTEMEMEEYKPVLNGQNVISIHAVQALNEAERESAAGPQHPAESAQEGQLPRRRRRSEGIKQE